MVNFIQVELRPHGPKSVQAGSGWLASISIWFASHSWDAKEWDENWYLLLTLLDLGYLSSGALKKPRDM